MPASNIRVCTNRDLDISPLAVILEIMKQDGRERYQSHDTIDRSMRYYHLTSTHLVLGMIRVHMFVEEVPHISVGRIAERTFEPETVDIDRR